MSLCRKKLVSWGVKPRVHLRLRVFMCVCVCVLEDLYCCIERLQFYTRERARERERENESRLC